MAGFFRDPTDANRKARGVRPFAGQTHEPGTGPLKGNPVRRQTLAPFKSPFAEPRESSNDVARLAENVEPKVRQTDPESVPSVESADATPVVNFESTNAWSEPEASPALPQDDFASALNTTDLQRDGGAIEDHNDWLQSITDLEPGRAEKEHEDDWFADASNGVEEVIEEDHSASGFAGIESLEAPTAYEWAAEEVLEDEVLEDEPAAAESLETQPVTQPEPPEASVAEFSEEQGSIESQLPLSPDWAVSPDAEADFHAYTAALNARERASELLETVARRVRSGEIVVAIEPGATTEAVLASVLTALLTNST